jgi:hypothetical protein
MYIEGVAMLNVTGRVIQIVALLLAAFGTYQGLVVIRTTDTAQRAIAYMAGTDYTPSALALQTTLIVAASLLAGLLLLGFGGICCAVASSASSNKRSAEALEAIADRRRASPPRP